MGTPRDWWEHDHADPTDRTASDGSVLESADPASSADADAGSGAETSAEAPPRRTEASSEGQTLSPAADPDRPTLEGAQEGESTADESAGLTREGRVYLEDDPRRSGDEEPTLDDKTQVDLSDTAPDGTPLRQGLTDVFGNEILRSRDLGYGLSEGMAVPGSDRLSGMMDPFAAGESGGGGGGSAGGKWGGIDPRLAAPTTTTTKNKDGSVTKETIEEVELAGGDYGVRITEHTVYQNLDEESTDRILVESPDGSKTSTVTTSVTDAETGKTTTQTTTTETDAEGNQTTTTETEESTTPVSTPEDKTTKVPAEEVHDPLTAEQIESALRHRQPGYVDPAEDADTQAVLVEGDYQWRPRPGLWDPVAPEDQPPRGSQSGQPLNRDPGYVDPTEDDSGGSTNPITGGRGGGPTPPTSDQAGAGDPRNTATGGPATQTGDAETVGGAPGAPPTGDAETVGGAPGAPPQGSGDVAVDPTEDEPQYGATTADADPLGMDIATAPPAGEAPAPPAPQGQEIGPGGQGGSEPAIKMDGGAVISMETGQVVAPAGPPPEPDLSGANLQGDVLGASESSGLPISGLETPPLGAPPDPGASESGDQQPSSSDDDGMP